MRGEKLEVFINLFCSGMISLSLLQTALAVKHLSLQPNFTSALGPVLNINIISILFNFLAEYNTAEKAFVGNLAAVQSPWFTLLLSPWQLPKLAERHPKLVDRFCTPSQVTSPCGFGSAE